MYRNYYSKMVLKMKYESIFIDMTKKNLIMYDGLLNKIETISEILLCPVKVVTKYILKFRDKRNTNARYIMSSWLGFYRCVCMCWSLFTHVVHNRFAYRRIQRR